MLNLNSNVLFGQQGFNHFRPLDEAKVATVEIVLETDVVGFLQFFNALEIKMIDRLPLLCDILIDDGESRAVHLIGDTHFVA